MRFAEQIAARRHRSWSLVQAALAGLAAALSALALTLHWATGSLGTDATWTEGLAAAALIAALGATAQLFAWPLAFKQRR